MLVSTLKICSSALLLTLCTTLTAEAFGSPSLDRKDISNIALRTILHPPVSLGDEYAVPDHGTESTNFRSSRPTSKSLKPSSSSADETSANVDLVTGYCASRGNQPWLEYITGVELGSINNTTSKSKYTDNTAQSTSLPVGSPQPIILTAGYSYFTFPEYFKVWIDYDQSGTFEEGREVAYEGILSGVTNGTYSAKLSGQIIVPIGATPGPTRMRVSMRRNAYPTACGEFTEGEVEDYTVVIAGESSPRLGFSACPQNIVRALSTGQTSTIVSWSAPTATATCPGGAVELTRTSGQASGTAFGVGTTVISYTATDRCGQSATCSFTVVVNPAAVPPSPPGGAYCNSAGDFPWHEWIARVELGDIDQPSGKERYSDFTGVRTTLVQGQSTPLVLTTGFSYFTAAEYYRIWIDYDQDGSFGLTEIAYQGILPPPANGTALSALRGSLTVPTQARTGTTRMRIALSREVYAPACGTFAVGETEDYTIVITSGGGTIVHQAPIGASVSQISPTSVTVSWGAPQPAPQSYEVRRDGGAAASHGATSYVFSGLSPSTAYRLEVRAIYPDGAKSAYVGLAATTAAESPGNGSGAALSVTIDGPSFKSDNLLGTPMKIRARDPGQVTVQLYDKAEHDGAAPRRLLQTNVVQHPGGNTALSVPFASAYAGTAIYYTASQSGTGARDAGGFIGELLAFRHPRPEPADFDAFWAAKQGELAKVPPNFQETRLPDLDRPNSLAYRVTADIGGGKKAIYWVAVPRSTPTSLQQITPTTKLPAVITFPAAGLQNLSYGINVADVAEETGAIAVSVYLFDETGAPFNYMQQGIQDKNTFFFLEGIKRCLRAVDFVKQHPRFNGGDIVAKGESQGGGLSKIMAGLRPSEITLLITQHDALSTHDARPDGPSGWPTWVEKGAATSEVGYYDASFHARRVKARKTFTNFGMVDNVTSPFSVLVNHNQVFVNGATKTLLINQNLGHVAPPEYSTGQMNFIADNIRGGRIVRAAFPPRIYDDRSVTITRQGSSLSAEVRVNGVLDIDPQGRWITFAGPEDVVFAFPSERTTTFTTPTSAGQYRIGYEVTSAPKYETYFSTVGMHELGVEVVGLPRLVLNACPQNIVRALSTGQTSTIVSWSAPTATTTCAAGKATITQNGGPASGSAFGVGSTIVTYMATDSCGQSETCSFTVVVTAAPPTPIPPGEAYCSSAGNFPWHEWIARVELGDIDQVSGKDRYSDFTSVRTSLVAGQTTPLVLTTGFSYFTATEYYRVWVDYDQDGRFGSPELAYQGIMLPPANGTALATLRGSIVVPIDARTGATRLRISLSRDSYAPACGTFAVGETEDYTVLIVAAQARQMSTRPGDAALPLAVLFPNPAAERTTLDLAAGTELESGEVISVTGQRMHSFSGTAYRTRYEFSTDNWPAGVYAVRLQLTDGQQVTRRLVVQHVED